MYRDPVRLPISVTPDPDDPRARQVLVEAIADGVAISMILDTGAYRSSVPHDERFTAAVQPDERSKSAGRRPADRQIGRIQSLTWGSLTATDLTVDMEPPDWPHSPLGMDVLGAHACHFRFSDGLLEADWPVPPGPFLPLSTPPNRAPVLPVEWGETRVLAVWDTGAGITTIDRVWADANPELVSITADLGTGTDWTTRTTQENPRGFLSSCRIGEVTFPKQDCGIIADWPAALENIPIILGLPLISLANWYMDFPNQRWTNSAPNE